MFLKQMLYTHNQCPKKIKFDKIITLLFTSYKNPIASNYYFYWNWTFGSRMTEIPRGHLREFESKSSEIRGVLEY